ncbi:hypothetical protein BJ165DRAFT_1514230 [Panaeolus papilionaceus]|nr:hypothetical protein BJ165DRAFT_1514230 [Panaeolus papilionaceus]
MSLLPQISMSRAVGAPKQATDLPFNDLQNNNWPAEQNIERITNLEIFHTNTRIHGFNVTYKLRDGTNDKVPHGDLFPQGPSAKKSVIVLNEGQLLVGAYGATDSNGVIQSLGFAVFDAGAGANNLIVNHGPFGNPASPKASFGSFGNIFAFMGTDNSQNGLRTLGFIKSDDIARMYGIISA